MDSARQEAAISYIKRGWSPIPIRPNGKKPWVPWMEYQERIATHEEVGQWFNANPSLNVGIVTGPVSGLLVLDIDSVHGGNESAKALWELIGVRPVTRTVKTPHGYHLYFHWPEGVEIHNTAGTLGKGLDTRGWHGYVVAPPSHVQYWTEPTDGSAPEFTTEGDYEWKVDAPITDVPRGLLDLLTKPVEKGRTTVDTTSEDAGATEGFQLAPSGTIRPGERHGYLIRAAGFFYGKGIDGSTLRTMLDAENNRACTVSVPDDEIDEIADAPRAYGWEGSKASKRPTLRPDIWPVRLSTLEATDQYWLFDRRIPLGHYTILEGDPDTKKSWITISWAAAITTDGEASCTMPGYVKVGRSRDVIILTSEDGLRDTYIRRAELLGCDLERVICLDLSDPNSVGFNLGDDGLATIARWLDTYDCPLVIFDPIVGWLGSETDPGVDVSIRTFLRKLEAMGQQYQCTFVGLRHLTKDSKSKAAYRGKGAIDWTAAARSAMLAGYSNEHKEWALITHKHNLAAPSPTLGYRLVLDEFESPLGFEWYESDLQAGDLLSSDLTTAADKQTKLEDAIEWITWYLADRASPRPSSGKPTAKEVPAFELDAAATKSGHAESTFKKAKTEAVKRGIAHRRADHTLGEAGVSRWLWSLRLEHQADDGDQHSHSQKGLEHQEYRPREVGVLNPQPSFSVTVPDEEDNDAS